jgi:hypothetical protein
LLDGTGGDSNPENRISITSFSPPAVISASLSVPRKNNTLLLLTSIQVFSSWYFYCKAKRRILVLLISERTLMKTKTKFPEDTGAIAALWDRAKRSLSRKKKRYRDKINKIL